MKPLKPDSEKVIKKAISLRPDQYRALGEVINLDRVGPFSQFIQDAIEEKLARISQTKTDHELKAS
jgi:hypothetical protein